MYNGLLGVFSVLKKELIFIKNKGSKLNSNVLIFTFTYETVLLDSEFSHIVQFKKQEFSLLRAVKIYLF